MNHDESKVKTKSPTLPPIPLSSTVQTVEKNLQAMLGESGLPVPGLGLNKSLQESCLHCFVQT
jgi:hypothetical protein